MINISGRGSVSVISINEESYGNSKEFDIIVEWGKNKLIQLVSREAYINEVIRKLQKGSKVYFEGVLESEDNNEMYYVILTRLRREGKRYAKVDSDYYADADRRGIICK